MSIMVLSAQIFSDTRILQFKSPTIHIWSYVRFSTISNNLWLQETVLSHYFVFQKFPDILSIKMEISPLF